MEELWEVLRPEEQIELKLRKLYTQHHFHPYHLNNFEEYGNYQQSYNFLRNSSIITFTGNDGRTMALKPDVTLSIAKIHLRVKHEKFIMSRMCTVTTDRLENTKKSIKSV